MKYVYIGLRILLGGIFIYSAYSKLFPVELFEYAFVNTGLVSWKLAPFAARFFIGLEFLLGAWLIFGIALKRFTLKAVFVLLLLFCAYLLFLIFVKKENGNCGCFGTAVMMTPIQALLKNVILLAAAYLLYVFPQEFAPQKIKWILPIAWITTATAFAIPFIANPLNYNNSQSFAKEKVNYHPPLELLYAAEQDDPPKVDLNKGKWIVAFLSLTCPHCRVAAYKLNVMHNKNPHLPVYFVLNGLPKDLAPFYKATNSQKIPHNFFKGPKNFLKLVGPVYPVIFWLNNGIVEKKSTHIELDQTEIEAWLAE